MGPRRQVGGAAAVTVGAEAGRTLRPSTDQLPEQRSTTEATGTSMNISSLIQPDVDSDEEAAMMVEFFKTAREEEESAPTTASIPFSARYVERGNEEADAMGGDQAM